MLALTSGLAAACFVKAFGITFLAIPRSPRGASARTRRRASMRVGMAMLALACVGARPGARSSSCPCSASALGGLGGLARAELAFTLGAAPADRRGALRADVAAASWRSGSCLLLALVPLALADRCGADRRLRVGDTWGCGRIGQTPRMEYTATAFAEPLRRVFAELYRPTGT